MTTSSGDAWRICSRAERVGEPWRCAAICLIREAIFSGVMGEREKEGRVGASSRREKRSKRTDFLELDLVDEVELRRVGEQA